MLLYCGFVYCGWFCVLRLVLCIAVGFVYCGWFCVLRLVLHPRHINNTGDFQRLSFGEKFVRVVTKFWLVDEN